jgi:hypothetical protein
LKPDGTFISYYLIVSLTNESEYLHYIGEGHFTYSAIDRKLTLISETLKLDLNNTIGDLRDQCNSSPEMIENLSSHFKKIEISNFFWAVSSFNFIKVLITKNSNGYELAKEEAMRMSFNKYSYRERVIIDKLNAVYNTIGEFATTIDKPCRYLDTTLFPDHSLSGSYSYHFDDNDTYESTTIEFRCKGSWAYDIETKTITLSYQDYEMIENGSRKVLENVPKEVTTNHFCFEGNFISALSCMRGGNARVEISHAAPRSPLREYSLKIFK